MLGDVAHGVFLAVKILGGMRAEVDDQELFLEPRFAAHALPTPCDDALGMDENGSAVEEHIDDGAHARHRGIEMKRQPVADDAAEDAEKHGEKERVMQALREEQRRGCRRDEERDDEDRADGVEGRDRRQGNQSHEPIEDRARRHADEPRALLVEGRKLELLVKEEDERRIDEEDHTHLERRGCDLKAEERHRIEPGIDDLAHQHHVRVEVYIARILADEYDGNRKEHRKDDADGVVALHRLRFP